MKLGPVLLLFSLLAVPGCTRAKSPTPAAAAKVTHGSSRPSETEDSCVDEWLTAHKLDSFGNPEGSDYKHGTPLMDEVNGQAVNRFDYVYAHHPEAKQACMHLRQPQPEIQ